MMTMLFATKQNVLFLVGILFMFALNNGKVVNGYSHNEDQPTTTTTLIRRSLTNAQQTQAQQNIPITRNLRRSLQQPERGNGGDNNNNNCPTWEERNRCNNGANYNDAYWCCYLCFGLSSCTLEVEEDGRNAAAAVSNSNSNSNNNNHTDGEEM